LLTPIESEHIPPGYKGYYATKRNNRRTLFCRSLSAFRLEQRPRKFGLPDDAQQRATPDWIVQGNRHRDGSRLQTLLHDSMAATLSDLRESMLSEDQTDV
jgi:hypothetical protein